MKKIVFLLFMFLTTPSFAYNTYYVRTDGGNTTQCTGLADAAYDGDGTGEACAFSNPMWATGTRDGGGILVGGDTLIIKSGSYVMGYGAGPTGYYCKAAATSYGCYMKELPSGPDESNPTKILGEGWDTGCTSPPELWGTQRAELIINLKNSSNIEIKCLEITDHAPCGSHTSTISATFPPAYCVYSSYPFGEYALTGIRSAGNTSISTNVLLQDLNIHGLADRGIFAGGIEDWTLRRVRIYSNGFTGWDMDTHSYGGDWGAYGTQTLDNVTIQYTGCAETYPGKVPSNCIGQGDGGQGDAFGSAAIGGDWVISDSNISFSTQDGLDMLYHRYGGDVTVKRSWFEGNAGNAIKINVDGGLAEPDEPGIITIENTVAIGSCQYYDSSGDGAAYRATGSIFLNCRGDGSTILANHPKGELYIKNSTSVGNGNALVSVKDAYSAGCDGTEVTAFYNNVFMGNYCRTSSLSGTAGVCGTGNDRDVAWLYNNGTNGNGDGNCGPGNAYDFLPNYLPDLATNNIVYNVQDKSPYDICPTELSETNLCVDPDLVDSPENGDATDVYLNVTSPAIEAADHTITISSGNDANNFVRGAVWDIGGLEYGSTPPAPSCNSECTLCESSGDCAASAATCYWQLNGSCQDTIDPCNADCLSCSTEALCNASTIPCYYWSTLTCNSTEEPEPPSCADDCTLCTSENCISTGPSCYLHLDDSCEATIDPCNASCGACTTETCALSTIPCFLWEDDVCRNYEAECDNLCTGCTSKNDCSGQTNCYWNERTTECLVGQNITAFSGVSLGGCGF